MLSFKEFIAYKPPSKFFFFLMFMWLIFLITFWGYILPKLCENYTNVKIKKEKIK